MISTNLHVLKQSLALLITEIRTLTNLRSSLEIGFKCMKLQKPDLVHSPISYCRQQASRKSVTGDNSA